MKAQLQRVARYLIFAAIGLFAVPLTISAQDHGSGHGGGGGGGCGDVFGDLIHILREPETGQPILAQRWIELPREVKGFGWGYCPIAVQTVCDEFGCEQEELGFQPYSCDVALEDLDLVEEVDYFGRLNGGRTKERNNRMHFDEVISNIKQAHYVALEETGRIKLGWNCDDFGKGPCGEFTTVDSPMESMALYVRVMKYGHFATDPYEIDDWAHGDPKKGPQFHPALSEKDWEKFDKSVLNLLPDNGKAKTSDCWDYGSAEDYTDRNGNGFWDPAEPFFDIDGDGEFDADGPRPEPYEDLDGDGHWNPAEPFSDDNDNGVADEFVFMCAEPEELSSEDFISGSTYLAAAASKTGWVSTDLLQYMNRILKITQDTKITQSTMHTLPALYRDCWDSDVVPVDPAEDAEIWFDPEYLLPEDCEILDADAGTPDVEEDDPPYSELYTAMQERFVNYLYFDKYKRAGFGKVTVVNKEPGLDSWTLKEGEKLLDWVELVNGDDFERSYIEAAVDAANDVIRSIEYVHNYDPPADLYCAYQVEGCYAE